MVSCIDIVWRALLYNSGFSLALCAKRDIFNKKYWIFIHLNQQESSKHVPYDSANNDIVLFLTNKSACKNTGPIRLNKNAFLQLFDHANATFHSSH